MNAEYLKHHNIATTSIAIGILNTEIIKLRSK